MSDQRERPYAHLGKRVLNLPSGRMGTIASAKRRPDVKRGWEISIEWDDGHHSGFWTDREISKSGKKLNKLVPDDFVPDYGPRKDRIEKLIERLDKGGIRWQRGYGTEARVGMDSLHIWKPLATFEAHASLYGGQGRWEGIGTTEVEAWGDLRQKLVDVLRDEEGGSDE